MCEAMEREVECAKTACEEFIAAVKTNGRCQYHEEITTGLSELKGGFKTLKWGIAIVAGFILGMQGTTLVMLIRHLTINMKMAVFG